MTDNTQRGSLPEPPAHKPGLLGSDNPLDNLGLAQPGAVPPPPLGANFQGWGPEKPSGLAKAAVILTGLTAVVGIVSALGTPSLVDSYKENLGKVPDSSMGAAGAQSLTGLIGLASFIVLALWIGKIRGNLRATGKQVRSFGAAEWWGWLVPIAWFVMPFLAVRAIARTSTKASNLWGWWLFWSVSLCAASWSFVQSLAVIDFSDGSIKADANFDGWVAAGWISAIAVVISWFFLQRIIRDTTEKHLAS